MVTVKGIWKAAAAATVGILALQAETQARRPVRNSPRDSLDPLTSNPDPKGYGGQVDYSNAPAPATPSVKGAASSPTAAPCLDVELAAALELFVVELGQATNATDCADSSIVDTAIFDDLEIKFGYQQSSMLNNDVQDIYAMLEGELQTIAGFTNSTNACDNITAYNLRVNDSVGNLYDTLSLLGNVTSCES